ncbi:hypothetical protein F5Y05DRAFT_419720 [Hypoxylon sp. FL0543]|nr:hypothetical protein F5Y05DRAFT_419720 [Hypoxylon sp. FL0543]
MKSKEPLQCLIKSSKPELVSHEIILVHGFNSKGKRCAECRRLLKSWVIQATEPIRDWVNVRIFPFDGAHILHTGHSELLNTTEKLSGRLLATGKDPSSPLFCSVGDKDRIRSSRAVVFVAHGMGAWVVKEFLNLHNRKHKPIDPTGLLFFDTPESTGPLKSNEVPPESILLQYLTEFSNVFKLKPDRKRLLSLQSELHKTNVEFRELVLARYGKSVEVKEDNVERFTYTLNLWTDNIWMSSTPLLKFSKINIKARISRLNILLGPRRNRYKDLPKKLERVKLEENLKRAITLHRYHNLQLDHLDSKKKPGEPANKVKLKDKDAPGASQDPSGSTDLAPTRHSNKPVSRGGRERSAEAGQLDSVHTKDGSTDANKKKIDIPSTGNSHSCCGETTPTDANENPSHPNETVSLDGAGAYFPSTGTDVPLSTQLRETRGREGPQVNPTMYDDI